MLDIVRYVYVVRILFRKAAPHIEISFRLALAFLLESDDGSTLFISYADESNLAKMWTSWRSCARNGARLFFSAKNFPSIRANDSPRVIFARRGKYPTNAISHLCCFATGRTSSKWLDLYHS